VKTMESSDGESFYLQNSVSTDGPVEHRMTSVEEEMKTTLETHERGNLSICKGRKIGLDSRQDIRYEYHMRVTSMVDLGN